VPFTCEVCGGRSWPEPIPAVGEVLRCQRCADERPFLRAPLLVVTGSAGIGKSTLCARLAGTVRGVVALDADIFAEDLISVVLPNQDYPAFWRSMMRLAHETSQNQLTVVFFATMLPEQLLANTDVLNFFASVQFLCLTCDRDDLQERIARRDGDAIAAARIEAWIEFDRALLKAAAETPGATVMDAGRSMNDVEHDVRSWIVSRVPMIGEDLM
jgi:gluconate kinase